METTGRPRMPSILIVDDEPSMRRYVRTLLELDDYEVETACSGTEALQRINRAPYPDVVLLDMLMPDMDGLEVLKRLREVRPTQKVIMLSCISDSRKVATAMRLGAHDYLTKPFHKSDLEDGIERCMESAVPDTEMDCSTAEGDMLELGDDVYFYAGSPAMRKIRSQAQLVAKVDIPVLMLGESGTGKEIVSKLIHSFSPRAGRPFTKVNCAAVPSELLESELFGYEAGAFTGANKPKPGKFELCNKGTILLDEIGEMSPALQAKLLHVLQDGTFSRLGSRTTVKADVRILAATNINVEQAMADRTFREDLYYRLAAFTLKLPPLRDRKEEIPSLLRHFTERVSEKYGRTPLPLPKRLIQACMEYSWPGNMRELENFVKRYLVLQDVDAMVADLVRNSPAGHSSARHTMPEPEATGSLKGLVRSLKGEAEADAIAQALQKTSWNRKRAAAELQISYKALLYKIRQYNISPPARGASPGLNA